MREANRSLGARRPESDPGDRLRLNPRWSRILTLAIGIAVVIFIAAMVFFLNDEAQFARLPGVVVALLVCLLTLGSVRRGDGWRAMWTIGLGAALYLVVATLGAGGLAAPAMQAVALMIVVPGWMLGRRAANLFALLALGWCLFLALAETQQWLPAPPPTPVALRLLIAGLVIACAYLLTRFGISAMRRRIGAIRSLNQALTEAHAVAARRLGDFETLANNLPGLVVRVDHTLTVTFANRSFLHVAEADRAKVIGQPLDRILQPAQMDAIRSAIDGALAGRTMKLLAPHFDSRQHGSVFEVVIVREDDEEGRIAGFLGLLYDVTERERLQVELHHAATHDTLTGLANRLNLETALEHALTRSARSKQALALLVVDLDGFKPVNDRFGHAAGDRLLRHVAQQLRGAVRGADLVARVGGDEFVILLEQVGEAATARALAEKVLAAVAEPLADEDQTLAVGASIGVALAPEHGQTPRELFEAADKAMYEAKRSGKNQVCIGQTRAGQPAATLSD